MRPMQQKRKKQKLSDEELDEVAYQHSTPEERMAVDQYRHIQKKASLNGGYWGEADMLIASQAVPIIVNRNKRLKKAGIL